MTDKEMETQVAQRRKEGGDMHDSIIKLTLLVEQLVGNGQEGTCAKRGRAIAALQKIVYISMGGSAVLVFLLKVGVISL